MRAKDINASLSYFEEKCTFILDDGRKVIGHQAIREALSGWVDAIELTWLSGPFSFTDADESIAFLTGHWLAKFPTPEGGVKVVQGRNTEVVRRQSDGSWKFLIDNALGADWSKMGR